MKVKHVPTNFWLVIPLGLMVAVMAVVLVTSLIRNPVPDIQTAAQPGAAARRSVAPPKTRTSPKPLPLPSRANAPKWVDVTIPEAWPGWQLVDSQDEPHPGVSEAQQSRIRWCGKQPLADTPENRRKGRVWLTFDDAGSVEQVQAIVGALNRYGVRGRFFVLGNWAMKPEIQLLLRQMEDQGHFIGHHSKTHKHPFFHVKRGPQPGTWRVMEQSTSVIKSELRGGVQSTMIRFPYGAYDSRALQGVSGLRGPNGDRVTVCGWTADSQDWKDDITPEKQLSYIQSGMSPNAVVLMHIQGKYTAQILPTLIRWLHSSGYRTEPLKRV